MKIEHCEWSKPNGEDNEGNTIWYCAHRTFCPYGNCEVPAKKKVEEPKKVALPKNVEIDKPRTAEYYENLIPTIKNLIANGLTTWTDIGKALKIKPNTVRQYYVKHGIRFEGIKVRTRDIDWPTIKPVIIAKRKEDMTWHEIADELGMNHETLRTHMQRVYDIY